GVCHAYHEALRQRNEVESGVRDALNSAEELKRIDAMPEASAAEIKPRWDAHSRQLWLGDKLARTFDRRAPTQFLVLDAFEKAGWPANTSKPLKNFSLKDAIEADAQRLSFGRFSQE